MVPIVFKARNYMHMNVRNFLPRRNSIILHNINSIGIKSIHLCPCNALGNPI